MDLIIRRRNSLFVGHVARLGKDSPAHQALQHQINISLGRLPDSSWNDVLQVAQETSGWIRFTLTTTSHLLICGDVLSAEAILGWRSRLKRWRRRRARKAPNNSHGSVATLLRCGGSFSDDIVTNAWPRLVVKEFYCLAEMYAGRVVHLECVGRSIKVNQINQIRFICHKFSTQYNNSWIRIAFGWTDRW